MSYLRQFFLAPFVVVTLLYGVSSFTYADGNVTFLAKKQVYADGNVKFLARQQANEHKSDASSERDDIFSLLAYSVVLKDWQTHRRIGRGYNIGSVLVNENHQVVYWARNTVNVTVNNTQHGEVRLMNCYLANNKRDKNLKGFTLYTTLEPCAMCSGMMFLTSLPRTVYGQKDPGFGDAIERLELDSTALPNGFPPYPRSELVSEGSHLYHRYWLDFLYAQYVRIHKDPHITEFLTTPVVKQVFKDAHQTLLGYTVKYNENEKILVQAQEYYEEKVSDTYQKLCPEQ